MIRKHPYFGDQRMQMYGDFADLLFKHGGLGLADPDYSPIF